MTYNCPQLAQDLQVLKDTFSVLKNQLSEFEDINSSSDVSRAEKITKLKELYQIRKKLQEMYPPLEIMKAWAEKYLATHKTSRKIAQTQEQALTGKYLFYSGNIKHQRVMSEEDLKFPKFVGGDLILNNLNSQEYLHLPILVGKCLVLNGLTSAEHLKLPQVIGGNLYLNSLTSAEHLDFKNVKVNGSYIFLYSLAPQEDFNILRQKYPDLKISR